MKREEALKILKKLHDTALFSVRTALETLIPELRESEDERIRKEIYNFLIDMECKKEWITYLEKQKEPKPAEWSEEDVDMLNSCISSIEEAKENRYAYKETDGDTSYDHEIAWLKSLRPRFHWEPSEYQIQLLLSVINDPNNAASASAHLALKSLYNDLKKL